MDTEKYLNMAISLADESIEKGGGPFGCVIVRGGEVVASASNSVTQDCDPTAHAEVRAIRVACKKLNTFILDDCELYTSCEPCPMCLGAIYWARIKKVYFAASKTDANLAGFDDSFIYDELGKLPSQRSLTMKQMCQENAQKTFKKWVEKVDKIKY